MTYILVTLPNGVMVSYRVDDSGNVEVLDNDSKDWGSVDGESPTAISAQTLAGMD